MALSGKLNGDAEARLEGSRCCIDSHSRHCCERLLMRHWQHRQSTIIRAREPMPPRCLLRRQQQSALRPAAKEDVSEGLALLFHVFLCLWHWPASKKCNSILVLQDVSVQDRSSVAMQHHFFWHALRIGMVAAPSTVQTRSRIQPSEEDSLHPRRICCVVPNHPSQDQGPSARGRFPTASRASLACRSPP